MRGQLHIVMAALVCACGARSEIAGGGFADGGVIDAFVAYDAGAGADGAPTAKLDSGLDAASCTPPSVVIGLGGPSSDGTSCKFDIEWTCDGVPHRIGGACDPPGVGPQGGTLQGVCVDDGTQTSTFDVPVTTCDCKDAQALLTLVQQQCTHQ